eukprot:jgi/Mesen1/9589/ME000657S08872
MGVSSTFRLYKLLFRFLVPLVFFVLGATIAAPAITDIAVGAICGSDECSEAIFISGAQSTVGGIGTMLFTPWVGGLSDVYGRKPFILLSFLACTLPYGVLAASVSRTAVYTYYAVKCVADVFMGGVLSCLMYAYVAGVTVMLLGSACCWLIMPNTKAGHQPQGESPHTRQVSPPSTAMQPAKEAAAGEHQPLLPAGGGDGKVGEKDSSGGAVKVVVGVPPRPVLLRSQSSVRETIGVLSNNFHYTKDQFAELFFIAALCAVVSMVVLLPVLVHFVSIRIILCIGLLFGALHVPYLAAGMFSFSAMVNPAVVLLPVLVHFVSIRIILCIGLLFGALHVPYLAAGMFSFSAMVNPAVGSIVSQAAMPDEQGKLQGVVQSLKSLASALGPLVISPLTAWFLSDKAPFHCPGFGIVITGFISCISLVLAFCMPTPPAARTSPIESNDVYDHLPASAEGAQSERVVYIPPVTNVLLPEP